MSACQALGGTRSTASPFFGLEVWDEVELVPPRCCNASRRIRTERDDDPESIQTSSVSFDLVTGSAPFQSFGFAKAHNSVHGFSNQMFEPCFSMMSATLRMTAAAVFVSFDGSGNGCP